MTLTRDTTRIPTHNPTYDATVGVGGWTPAELFNGSTDGVWIDPSDLSTMFTTDVGTTNVTADGDPVGRIEDKSGNGNNFTQSTAADRPTYKTDGTLHWLLFGGGSDYMQTAAFTSTWIRPNSILGAVEFNAANDYAWDGITAGFRNALFTDATDIVLYAGAALNGDPFVGAAATVVGGVYDSTNSILSVDGVDTLGNTGNNNSTGITLGGNYLIGGFLAGKNYGLVGLDAAFTSNEKANLDIYLSRKAGI